MAGIPPISPALPQQEAKESFESKDKEWEKSGDWVDGMGKSRNCKTQPRLTVTVTVIVIIILIVPVTIKVLDEISRILDTGLDRDTLSYLVGLCECGVNPEALAAVVKELRRESTAVSSATTSKVTQNLIQHNPQATSQQPTWRSGVFAWYWQLQLNCSCDFVLFCFVLFACCCCCFCCFSSSLAGCSKGPTILIWCLP